MRAHTVVTKTAAVRALTMKTIDGAKTHGKEEKVAKKETIRSRKNPALYKGALRAYLKFSRKVEALTLSDSFKVFIILVILAAGILVGLQTYGCSDEVKQEARYSCYTELHENATIELIDTVILIVFILEAILKMMAEGFEPWRYFTGPEWAWNNFDFAIIVLCLPIIPTGSDSTVAVLRLFRLMRVMKLVGKIPQLQMIVKGLVSGMKSIGYIGVLLALVYYLYAVIGISFFAENDPWHFRNLVVSFNTLFRMMTLEDWTDVMYINMYGCDATTLDIRFDSGLYTVPDAFQSSVVPNNVSSFECARETKANVVIVVLYFVSFVIISALVALSLVLGAITIGMADSMAEMKALAEEKERLAKLVEAEKKRKKMRKMSTRSKIVPHSDSVSSIETAVSFDDESAVRSEGNSSYTTEHEDPEGPRSVSDKIKRFLGVDDGDRHEELMRAVIRAAWDGEKISIERLESRVNDLRTDESRGPYKVIAKYAAVVRDSSTFQNLVTLVILAAGVVVGIEADSDEEQVEANAVILSVFIVEIIVKVVAEYRQPLRFFWHDPHGLDGWNLFDFVVVAGSLIPMGSASSIVTMLRLLRLLRVLKLVKALPALQVIVEALVKGVKSIYYIGIIMFLFLYLFGILGMILFRENDPWHFGTLHDTLVTLFRMTTLEDWTDVMYTNMFGCLNYGYADFPDLCDPNKSSDPHDVYRQFAVMLYCWFVVLYGGLMLVPLFIGVIVSSMEEAVHRQKAARKAAEDVDKVRIEDNIPAATVALYTKVFDMIDVDEGGTVDADEIKLGLSMVGICLSDVDLASRISHLNENSEGEELTKATFVKFMCRLREQKRAEQERERNTSPSISTASTKEESAKPPPRRQGGWLGVGTSDSEGISGMNADSVSPVNAIR